ncbi:hypothetical protein [Clostridium tetani]|uniref:hypothetical protein n=1 Tax=Clostridium tetani TaxID=1513 RepID=UPI0024A8F548|nr:hypothetical protein [Clostridium tetani]
MYIKLTSFIGYFDTRKEFLKMDKKIQKSIRVDRNLDIRIKDMCRILDISQSAYIKLCVLKDLEERKG